MSSTLWTVDAHCHWSDERLFSRAEARLPELVSQGLLAFQLGGVDPEEWQRQTRLSEKFPGRIWRAFGLHPYFVAEQPLEVLEQAWKKLTLLGADVEALGEMGLDFRHTYVTAGKDRQIEYLQRQLNLALELKKPVILHVVRAHEEVLHELRGHSLSGMVHGFTKGPQVAKRYMDLGYKLSIGAKLLYAETHDLKESVQRAPLENLLIESDCPDQPPPGMTGHDSISVFAVAKKISELKKLPLDRVLEQTRANLFSVIKREIRP